MDIKKSLQTDAKQQMVRATVQVYGVIREKLGTGKAEVQASTVAGAIEQMERLHGSAFRDLVFEGKSVRAGWMVLVNGRNVDQSKLAQIALKDGDVVHIFPPIAGG